MARLRYTGMHAEVDIPDADAYGIACGDEVDIPDDVAFGTPHVLHEGMTLEDDGSSAIAVHGTSGLVASGVWEVVGKAASTKQDPPAPPADVTE